MTAAEATAAGAALRLRDLRMWRDRLHTYAEGSPVQELLIYEVEMGAVWPNARAFRAYTVPADAPEAGVFRCNTALWRVGDEAMLFFVRPGWMELAQSLLERFWTGIATNGDHRYAVEACRVLDPMMRKLAVLRGGGCVVGERWTTMVRAARVRGRAALQCRPDSPPPPRAQGIPAQTGGGGGAAGEDSDCVLSAVCSFRMCALPPTRTARAPV